MVSVIIAAAGSGSRMGHSKKKQFIELEGEPVLVRTIKKFQIPEIDEIVVVTSEEDIEAVYALKQQYNLRINQVVAGGQTRQQSVYQALSAVTGDVVMVHDAARPFVSVDIIKKHLEVVGEVGVITAVPCKDTIKVVENNYVKQTPDRSTLVNVQTPQSFLTHKLKKAYEYVIQHDIKVTDDASVYEAFDQPVQIIMGSYDNIKLTTKEDLIIGAMILKHE